MSASDILLRDYVPEDAPALLALWERAGMATPGRGDDAAQIARTLAHGARLFVCFLPGADPHDVAGSAWITNDARRLYLHHLAVRPDLRRRGLGERLVRRALALASELGMQLKLEVYGDNDDARRIYARLGFAHLRGLEVHIVRAPRSLDG